MHAENVDTAVKRLTQKPMDIAPAYIPLMNLISVVHRVHLPKAGEMKAYRRLTSVDEIVDYEDYRNVFKWKPTKDSFDSSVENSALLPAISKHAGLSKEELIEEIKRRRNVLGWMRKHNIRSYRDVAAIITEYYSRPKEFYAKKVEKFVSAT